MTTVSLTPAQRRIQAIIEALGFGIIQGLVIHEGQPWFDPAPRIVQSIKLDSHPEPMHLVDEHGPPKQAFVDLFQRLSALGDCTVDIEIHHGLPFRLVVERIWPEMA